MYFLSNSRYIIRKSMPTRIGSIDAHFGPEASTRTANHITFHKFLLETVSPSPPKRIQHAHDAYERNMFNLHSAPLSRFSLSLSSFAYSQFPALSDQIHWNGPNRWPNWNARNAVRAVCGAPDHTSRSYRAMQLCRPLIYRAPEPLVWRQCINRCLDEDIASKCAAVHAVNAITGMYSRHCSPEKMKYSEKLLF